LSPGQSYTFFARARYYKYGARWSVPTTKFFSIPTNCDSGFDYALTADPARILVTPGGGDGKSTINIKKVSGMFDERTNLYIKQISGQGSSTPDSSQPMPIQLSTGDKKLTAALLSEIKELPPNSLRVKITSQGTDAPFTVRAAADTPVGVYVVTVASNLIPIQTVPVTVDVRKVIATTPSCAAAGEGKTNVSWARVLNATGYAIYRSADGVNFSVITPGALEASAGNISFTDSGLSPKQQYTYKIQSNFASGASEALGAASTAASACSVPKVNLTATPNLVDYGSQSKLTLKATGLDTGADYSCAASADPTSSIWSGDVTGISGDSLNYPIKDDGKGAITGSVASDPLTTTKTFSVRCSRIVNKELVYTTSRVAVKVKLSASCKAEPSVVSSGGIVKWTADPKGGDGAYQYQWNGNDFPSSLTTNPYYYVTYDKLTPSPKTASVAVTSGDGQTVNVNCGNSVTMSPTPIATASLSCAPPGGLPSANPLYLKYGGAATFSWNTNNVTPNSCQLSVSPNAAGWPKNNLPANQNQSDTPLYQSNPIVSDQPSTFTLTCDPTRAVGGGAVSASCAVSAPLACRTVDLKLDGKDGPAGNPVSVDYGYSGRFTWATTNIDDNVSGTASGKDSWSGPKTCQSGVRYSQSTGPFVYNGLNGWRYQLELQCPNPDPRCGNPSDTVYVNVNCQDAGPDFDLLASPATVAIRYIKGVGGSPVSTQTNVSVVADTCRNFNGDVGLSAGPNKLGGVDVVYNFDKQTLPSSGYGAGSNLSVSAKNKPIPEGIYPITITGLSGSLTRTAVINLNVGTLGLKYQEF
jgi:hypothetical protein